MGDVISLIMDIKIILLVFAFSLNLPNTWATLSVPCQQGQVNIMCNREENRELRLRRRPNEPQIHKCNHAIRVEGNNNQAEKSQVKSYLSIPQVTLKIMGTFVYTTGRSRRFIEQSMSPDNLQIAAVGIDESGFTLVANTTEHKWRSYDALPPVTTVHWTMCWE